MSRRTMLLALGAVAAIGTGCGDDGDSQSRLERIERRYEQLWDAESVSCREAPSKEGYECRIVSKQQTPGATRPESAP